MAWTQPQYGGGHRGRRQERPRAHVEQDFGLRRLLGHHGQTAIHAAAGRGQHALCEFLLHHEDGAIHDAASRGGLEDGEENRRSHDVGQIAHHHEGPTGRPRARDKVEIQGVALDDFQVALLGELGAQDGGEPLVAIDGDDLLRRLHEARCQCPEPGADLDHHIVGVKRGRGHNALLRVRIDEKILPQGFPGRKTMPGKQLARAGHGRARGGRAGHDRGNPGSTLRSSPPRSPRLMAQVPASAIMAALSVHSLGVGM